MLRFWTGLTLLLGLACAQTAPPTDLDAHMAAALATRAEELLAEGETDRARDAAQRALDRAVSAGARIPEARALHVLGLVDGDLPSLQRALQMLEDQPPSPALWRQRTVAAELALERERPTECLRLTQRSLDEAEDWDSLEGRMRIEAPLHRLRARALAALGRDDESFAADRRAAQSLSVLDDAELLALRRAVAQSLGDHYAARGDPREAFEQHARASALAKRLGELEPEFVALRAMSRDLVAMGRWLDAADHARRGVQLARRELDPERARDLGLEALGWLEGHPAPEAAARREALLAALEELEAAGG